MYYMDTGLNSMKEKIKIVNIIASSKISGNINIEYLNDVLLNSIYEPEQFPGLIYRKSNEYTIIMFYSGKISSHGTKTEDLARKAILDTVKEISKNNGIIGSSSIDKINIENMVASCNFNKKIDIGKILERFHNIAYKPKGFPGVIYKPFNDSVTCLLFSSGKVNIVGAKNKEQIFIAFNRIESVLDSEKSNT